MMYIIMADQCIGCGSCAPFCKNGAISAVDGVYVIDSTRCDCCGTCREYCPVDNTIVDANARQKKFVHVIFLSTRPDATRPGAMRPGGNMDNPLAFSN